MRMIADIATRLGTQLKPVERREIPRYLQRIRALASGRKTKRLAGDILIDFAKSRRMTLARRRLSQLPD